MQKDTEKLVQNTSWEKEFEKRFIGYEKVSGGIGLSYVTDVDNPYLKNDISGIKDFIQETLSNREKEIAEEVAVTFAKSPLNKRKDKDADAFYLDVLQIIKH